MNHSSLSCEQLIRLDVNHHVMVTVCLPPQSTLLAGAEMSVELVSDFAELVATMPEQIDHTPQPDTPPILACGDSSIASAALAMLQVWLRTAVLFPRLTYCVLIDRGAS